MTQIFAYITHQNGIYDESVLEIVKAASKIDSNAQVTAIAIGSGSDLDKVCNDITPYFKEVWKISNEAFVYPNAEIIRKVLAGILPKEAILIAFHDTFGMDLCPGLSIKMDASFVSDIVDIEGADGTDLKIIRQEYGGAVSTHVLCDISSGAVMTIRPGLFLVDEDKKDQGTVVDKSGEVGEIKAGRRFIEVVEAEVGDVDITKSDILISIGRGIEEEDNIEVAQELAKILGGVVSCSRPIVDAKWMEKSRQVGTSGKTVKPKIYFALGISGSFQHIGGIKGAPFMIAVNKNPNAPIFQVADVGIVEDILDFMPAFTERLEELE